MGGTGGEEGLQHSDDIRRRNLAARVRAVLGPEQAGFRGAGDRVGEGKVCLAEPEARIHLVRADAEAVENGGDAGRGDLRVVGEHSATGVPSHGRAWLVVRFEMIRVQLDQARQEVVAFEIDARPHGVALAYLRDAAVLDGG